MYRRRRRVREIAFSFDSFLDVVANVCGIIIRLILVVWVGARSYNNLKPTAIASSEEEDIVAEAPAALSTDPEPPLPEDPLQEELARQRRELEQAQRQLLKQLRDYQQVEVQQKAVAQQLADVTAEHDGVLRATAALSTASEHSPDTISLTMAEVRQRSRQLLEQLQELERQPSPPRSLRYRTPISRPVHSDELYFECRYRRITPIDVTALLAEMKNNFEEKGKQLHDHWSVSDVVGPVGAFRMRYIIERERDTLDSISESSGPSNRSSYRYGLSGWQIEPAAFFRGETVEAALAEGSEFRQVVDRLDPQQTVVTLWVYPDSFALFRQLRDYLYEHDIVVAGRPLTDEMPIASSQHGTVSRGQ